jgi:ZIP family zinc transporter
MDSAALLALGLTALAGLSTGIGGAIALFVRRSNVALLAVTLGFSAGVMIYVSFVELLAGGQELLQIHYGKNLGGWLAAAGFFGGVLLILVIDYLVPAYDNPHHVQLIDDGNSRPGLHHLHRVGLLSALAIGIHNFPEGVATFMAVLADPVVGLSIAIAIALHNIPEGIAIAVPVYYASGSRRRAFWVSFLSGLAEPVGALAAYLLLRPYLDDGLLGLVFAAVAGIMVFISLDQLIPNAKKYASGHQAVYGLIAGMAIMALTLLLLG